MKRALNGISLRAYLPSDYPQLKNLYESSGWFDPETDSEEKITRQIKNDPESILLAFLEEGLIGSITILATGRLGLLFRLVTLDGTNAEDVCLSLIKRGEEILHKKEYKEVHILAQEEDIKRQQEYKKYGFKKGKSYRWFWKKI